MNDDAPKLKQKRRGHNEGTGYQRADGRWEWRISLEDGRRKSFYAATQRGARQKANEYLHELAQGLDPGASKITVAEFLSHWLEHTAKQRVRPATLRSYTGLVTTHILPVLGNKRLRSLTAQDVNDMLAGMVRSGTLPSTANLTRAVLRTALNSAIRAGYVRQNSASLADPRPYPRQRIQPLTIAQARQFMASTRDHRLGMLFSLAIHTGLRQGELLALNWNDVDLERGQLHVRSTVTRVNGRLTRTAPKTEHSRRSIQLAPSAVRDLRTQRRRIGELELLATSRWQENNLVFPSAVGTFLNGSNVTYEFQKQIQRADLPRQRFHDLRHCTASILLAEGMDLFAVKEILGHSQINLTANTYGHLLDKLSKEAASRMESALGDGDDE